VAVAMLEGTLHAFDDTCPHAGCSLAEGELDGRTVVCPCHMATFDVTTGAVLDGPAPSGIATWSVTVDDGTVVLSAPGSADSDQAAQETSTNGAPLPSVRPDMDIIVLVEQEHEVIRQQFRALDALTDGQDLTEAWATLVDLLEVHASGEESMLYPKLARAADEGADEAEHAVRDHNDIRDSVRDVDEHAAGSEEWWRAVRRARDVNEEHLQEEERDALPLFRESTDRTRREALGEEWVAFHEQHQHAQGLSGDDVDPRAVVRSGS
jgi:nitrite reductase/ring-hydroxylating ferredoxin subunit